MTPLQLQRFSRSVYFAPVFLLAFTILVFADLFLGAQRLILSQFGTDVFLYFSFVREFGFSEIRQGNFPLWNPYLFSGTPFFGNLQPALLYPINWIHLVLPLDRGINLEIAIHVYLTGLGMYYWTRNNNLHRAACLVAATMWMFGAPYFLKITAGHLAPLAAMCWIPWILLALDWLFDNRFRRGCLLGTFAGAMLLLAGHPQTAYNTAIAVVLYVALRFLQSQHCGRVALGIGVIAFGAVALSAAQLGAGWAVAQESARSGAVPQDFARTFAQPPENFITLLAPDFFSDLGKTEYWGRAYIWEVSLFMGVTGFVLAMFGALSNFRKTYQFWLPLLFLWLFALSAYTPLFDLLYSYLPGFNKFRGHSKFIVPAAAFLSMLAAIGLDHLLAQQYSLRHNRALLSAVGLLACVAGLVGTVLYLSDNGLWSRILAAVAATQESYAPHEMFTNPGYIRLTAEFAAKSLFICSATAFLVAGIIWVCWRKPRYLPYAIGCLAVIEVVIFARTHRPTFELSELEKFTAMMSVKAAQGPERYLGTQSRNAAMGSRTFDLWGYDPVVLGRYIQFIAWTQSYDPDQPNPANVRFQSYNRLYAMLRCRYILLYNEDGGTQIGQLPQAMPQVLLMNEYSVLPSREQMFDAMESAAFDPRRRVLLETAPIPAPATGAINGSARVTSSSTDHLIIEADVKQPAILLVTDAYSKDWKAWGLEGSAQSEYSVLPANYVLRAIPLQAGQHKIRLQYSPTAFHVGKWISLLSLIMFCGSLCFVVMKRRELQTFKQANSDEK